MRKLPPDQRKSQLALNAQYRDRKRDLSRKQPGVKPPKPPKHAFQPPPDPRSLSDEGWLLMFLPQAFPLPFGEIHISIIAEFRHAIKTGERCAIAAPRGTGKTTLVNALALRALLDGDTPFPVVVPWADKARKQALRFWSGELCYNDRLHAAYPKATLPFKQSNGIAQRLATLTNQGDATGARLGMTEGVIVLPDNLGAIGSATLNGNPRGINYRSLDGSIVRPSLVIIDDPQDRKTAESRERIAETISRVNADIGGMAGPSSRMAMMMTCTVIKSGDVADSFLSNQDWRSIRTGQVTSWPAGWDDQRSECRRLWDEWNVVRLDGEQDHDGGKSALEFYEAHKASMTVGMSVSWDHRFDAKRGQPDALYAAMYDFYSMGKDAFMAERQNEPLSELESSGPYRLTSEIIMARTTDRPPAERPDWCVRVIASTDLNPSYAFSTVVVGFGVDQSAAVLWYGLRELYIPQDIPAPEYSRRIYDHLSEHGKILRDLPCRVDNWALDAGGQNFDSVLRFAAESPRIVGIPAEGYTGRGSRNYRPWGKTVFGQLREKVHRCQDMKDGRTIHWIAWNADYWREKAQRAWLGDIGAPGAVSLPAGKHSEFADQIVAERLLGVGDIGGQMLWTWETKGKHDFGDAMAQAYASAAMHDIGTGGQVVKKDKPKANIPMMRPSFRRR